MARILVVDDDPGIRRFLEKLLQRRNHTVRCAENGRIAVAVCDDFQPEVLITDIMMPEKDGLETIMEFRNLFPRAKIIAISGDSWYHTVNYLTVARQFGAHDAFKKPLDIGLLTDSINSLLIGKTDPAEAPLLVL
jgi:DNA-binding response OmpR family regulator